MMQVRVGPYLVLAFLFIVKIPCPAHLESIAPSRVPDQDE